MKKRIRHWVTAAMNKQYYWAILALPILIAFTSCSPKKPTEADHPQVNTLLGLRDVKSKTGLILPDERRLLMSEIISRTDSEVWIVQISSTNQAQFPVSAQMRILDEDETAKWVRLVESACGISIPSPAPISNFLWHFQGAQCDALVIISGKDQFIRLRRIYGRGSP